MFLNFFASFIEQQREMTQFCVVRRTWTAMANFFHFFFWFTAVFRIQFRGSFYRRKQTKWLQSNAKFVGEIEIYFLTEVVHGVAVVGC